jgi:pilus assembly protein CpaF
MSGSPTFGQRRSEATASAITLARPSIGRSVSAPTAEPGQPASALPVTPVPPVAAGVTALPAPNAQLLELRGLCMSRIDAAAAMSPERLRMEVERLLAEIADERRIQLSAREQYQLALELVDDMLGLGPLEPLLADDSVTDIMVNGPARVFVERRGKLVELPIRFRDAQHVGRIAQRIASSVGRRIDESSPPLCQ